MRFKTTFFTNIVILALGVLFILTSKRSEGIEWITSFTGITFVVLSFINGFMLTRQATKADEPAKGEQKPKKSSFSLFLGWVCCAAALILGAVMIITPETFHKLMLFIFGAVLIVGGIYHFVILAHGIRPVKFPAWFYVFPSLLCLGGVLMLFLPGLRDESNQGSAMLVCGIGLIAFVAIYFIELIGYKFMYKAAVEAQQKPADGYISSDRQIEDADAVEVSNKK